jgi:hypothetical protein
MMNYTCPLPGRHFENLGKKAALVKNRAKESFVGDENSGKNSLF